MQICDVPHLRFKHYYNVCYVFYAKQFFSIILTLSRYYTFWNHTLLSCGLYSFLMCPSTCGFTKYCTFVCWLFPSLGKAATGDETAAEGEADIWTLVFAPRTEWHHHGSAVVFRAILKSLKNKKQCQHNNSHSPIRFKCGFKRRIHLETCRHVQNLNNTHLYVYYIQSLENHTISDEKTELCSNVI